MLGYHGFHSATRNMAGEAAVARAEERADRAEGRLARLRAKSDQASRMVVRKALVAGTSAGLGFWQGYKGEMPELLGVGADLWIGAGASAVALFGDELGIDEKYADMIDAVGTGALAFWAANQGNLYGVKKAETTTTEGAPVDRVHEFAPHVPSNNESSPSFASVPHGYR